MPITTPPEIWFVPSLHVDDPAAVNDAHRAAHTQLRYLRLPLHLNKLRAERVRRIIPRLRIRTQATRSPIRARIAHLRAAQHLGNRHRRLAVRLQVHAPAFHHQIIGFLSFKRPARTRRHGQHRLHRAIRRIRDRRHHRRRQRRPARRRPRHKVRIAQHDLNLLDRYARLVVTHNLREDRVRACSRVLRPTRHACGSVVPFSVTVAELPPLHAPHGRRRPHPSPSTVSPRRIEPTSSFRPDHPNFSAPTCKHSFRCRDENGFPLLSSVSVSFFSRSSTGSIFSFHASSSIADSTANNPGTAPGPRIGHGDPIVRCTSADVTSRFGVL